ncbi:hypothetical protein B0T16DRAFT_51539 [Cercophora newfieldiana]|uniref:Uncharacterized protein n=1 Tax=Cercophora newfieldiana TaxID=92897 RepID=A0AA39YTD4_9PEZI|nr:hypothetical protein B0T16DRAFT_51539 [Cercophora newfieldiana]
MPSAAPAIPCHQGKDKAYPIAHLELILILPPPTYPNESDDYLAVRALLLRIGNISPSQVPSGRSMARNSMVRCRKSQRAQPVREFLGDIAYPTVKDHHLGGRRWRPSATVPWRTHG